MRHLAPTRRGQSGLTLVELMISIAIGLVVVGAVTYMYIGSKGAYRGNAAQARVQEAGRFALDSITNDIRRAGGLGCGTLGSVYTGAPVSVNVIPPSAGVNQIAIGSALNPVLLTVDNNAQPIPIQGLTLAPAYPQPPTAAPAGWSLNPPSGPAPPPYRGGDILQLQIASGTPVQLTGNPDTNNGNFPIASNTLPNGAPDFNQNDFVILANCSSAAVFQTPTTPAGSPPLVSYKVGGTVPTLTQSQQLGFGLGTYSTVQHFDQVTYYLGTVPGSSKSTGGPSSALYRYSMANGTAEEVADNVEDIDVSYGVGAGAPVFQSADAVTAANAWPNVFSVRISVIAVGDEAGVVSAPQSFPFHGAGTGAAVQWNAPDTRLRQVFTITAMLRNRLP